MSPLENGIDQTAVRGSAAIKRESFLSLISGDADLVFPILKRVFDVTMAVLGLAVLVPIMFFISILILVCQGRPILIRHRRLGRNGESFDCLKFRTMVRNPDQLLEDHLSRDPSARAEWSRSRKLKSDPRVTPVGRMLRKSSIDELPQLLNIIRGDMSVVGPRPIVRDEVRFYGSQIDDYYRVRPGLTGLWQVSGRSDASYGTRVTLDSEYARSACFVGDLKIIARTIPAVVRGEGSY